VVVVAVYCIKPFPLPNIPIKPRWRSWRCLGRSSAWIRISPPSERHCGWRHWGRWSSIWHEPKVRIGFIVEVCWLDFFEVLLLLLLVLLFCCCVPFSLLILLFIVIPNNHSFSTHPLLPTTRFSFHSLMQTTHFIHSSTYQAPCLCTTSGCSERHSRASPDSTCSRLEPDRGMFYIMYYLFTVFIYNIMH
jgi:hypothetical protein